jgi:diguanylate cyclase (GGDEF)-like protein/PAS domain S-box-containing protein
LPPSEGAAFREAEERFRLAFDNAPIGMALVAPDGRWLRVNRAICEIVGFSRDELLAKTFQDITHPEDLGADLAYVRQMLADEIRTYSMEKRYLHSSGRVVWINLSVSLARDEDGAPMYFISQIEDITARKAHEEALRRNEQRFRRLIETSTEAFIAMNGEGFITEWNRGAEETFGWSCDEVLGRRLVDTIIPPTHREAHNHGLARYLATGEGPVLGQRLELEGRRRDGAEFPVELTIWALDAGPEVSFNALLHDISERRRLEEQLWELALVDELTGLHNRRSFLHLAAQALKEAARAQRPVIGVFMDVDGLKMINDTYGHAEGDRALRLVAGALQGACRDSDIVGRLGGDEFAVLLAEAHEPDGVENRIRRRLEEAAAAAPYLLSLSIGVVRCEAGHECQVEELLEQADQSMYQEKAKRRGANS